MAVLLNRSREVTIPLLIPFFFTGNKALGSTVQGETVTLTLPFRFFIHITYRFSNGTIQYFGNGNITTHYFHEHVKVN